MTEDEAKTKWCPFSRMAEDMGASKAASANRAIVGLDRHTLCIGSACMAWRSVTQTVRTSRRTGKTETVGHCGLAGKP